MLPLRPVQLAHRPHLVRSSRTSRWCERKASRRRCPTSSAAFAIGAAVTGAAGASSASISASSIRHSSISTTCRLPDHRDHRRHRSFCVVVAGIALSALPEVLRFSADLRMIIYGVILVIAVFVMPSASPAGCANAGSPACKRRCSERHSRSPTSANPTPACTRARRRVVHGRSRQRDRPDRPQQLR